MLTKVSTTLSVLRYMQQERLTYILIALCVLIPLYNIRNIDNNKLFVDCSMRIVLQFHLFNVLYLD